jgi:hypothetical protein
MNRDYPTAPCAIGRDLSLARRAGNICIHASIRGVRAGLGFRGYIVALANRPRRSDNCREMSGIFFDNPAVRFPRRFRVSEIMTRCFASVRWLIAAACRPKCSRREEAEFPAAAQIALQTFRGSPAADCASYDALRLQNNWVKIKDQYETSIIRETFATLARWISTETRWACASAIRGRATARKEITVAALYGAFFKWKAPEPTVRAGTQWCAARSAPAAAA